MLKRRFQVLLILATLCGIPHSACKKGVTGDAWTIIKGRVLDSVTESPIESARLVVEDTLGKWPFDSTDTAGNYMLDLLGLGEFNVYCQKSGYATKQTTVHSRSGHTLFEHVDFSLAPINTGGSSYDIQT